MTAPTPSKNPHATSDAFALDNVDNAPPVSSRYRDCVEDVHTVEYQNPDTQATVVERVLSVLGMSNRRRKGAYAYEAAPGGAEDDDTPIFANTHVSKHHPRREGGRRHRARAMAFLRRTLYALPVLVLMFFGVLHILQVLIGSARLFWDVDAYDEFLPDWGKLGHVGEGLVDYPTDTTRDILPVSCHSHNDYWRRVPLFEALHYGCTSVEADVWCYDDELYVGHNVASLTMNRTFRNLYVNPLVDLLEKMNPATEFANASGHGVFDVAPEQTLVLLVDFKTNGHDTWPVVMEQLAPLREKGYLTYWDGEKVHSRAVTVVGTGNTPFDMVVNSTEYRDIFFDAPLNKLWEAPQDSNSLDAPIDGDDGSTDDTIANPETSSAQSRLQTDSTTPSTPDAFNTTNSYYASVSFRSAVGLVWRGHLSPRQMEIIRGQIRGARRRGLKARYWETPAWPIALRNHVWHVLMKEGAEVLNADDLKAAATANWKFRAGHGIVT